MTFVKVWIVAMVFASVVGAPLALWQGASAEQWALSVALAGAITWLAYWFVVLMEPWLER